MTTSSRATVVIGTRKGLVLARREGSTWSVDQLRFPLQAVYGVGVDNLLLGLVGGLFGSS